jgi:hypothetical protein
MEAWQIMRYRALLNNETVFFDTYDRFGTYPITDAVLTLEVNAAGTFEFKIYPENPAYSKMKRGKDVIWVYRDSDCIFKSVIMEVERDFHNVKTVTSDGVLSLLDDCTFIQSHTNLTPLQLVELAVGTYEDQCVLESERDNRDIGAFDTNINFTDNTASGSYITKTYVSCWDFLIDTMAKVKPNMIITCEYGTYPDTRIVITEEPEKYTDQTITLGDNLLDFTETDQYDDLYTIVVPLGKQQSEDSDADDSHRVNIASVNNNQLQIANDTNMAKYGRIWKVLTWDYVTDASELYRLGKEALYAQKDETRNIEISAYDNAHLKNITPFALGKKVHIVSEYHDYDDWLTVLKIDLDLCDPTKDKYTFGTKATTLSGS